MSKPVIIFGAGASRALKEIRATSLNNRHYFPPLTNELFDERFVSVISRFNLIKERLEQIEFVVKHKGSLEDFLSRLYNDKTEISQMQLAELRLYLKALFDDIHVNFFDGAFKNTSYYVQFIRYLSRYHKNACLITFNYDLFLDEAIKSVFKYKYNSIESYYEDREYELYKVHGSIDWHYLIPLLGNEDFGTPEKRIEFIVEVTENQKKADQPLRPTVFNRGGDYSKHFEVPALAIPLPDSKEFIVPEHESRIINNLKQTDKIIIIGWSASDEYFVELIMDNVDLDKVELIVVSPSSAGLIVDKLSPKKESELLVRPTREWKIEPITIHKSFSDLVSDLDELDKVFS